MYSPKLLLIFSSITKMKSSVEMSICCSNFIASFCHDKVIRVYNTHIVAYIQDEFENIVGGSEGKSKIE